MPEPRVLRIVIPDFPLRLAAGRESVRDYPAAFLAGGQVVAVSDRARAAGLAPGMTRAAVARRDRALRCLPWEPRRYAAATATLARGLLQFAPAIEPDGYGRFYLDLTGLRGCARAPLRLVDRVREYLAGAGFPLRGCISATKPTARAVTTALAGEGLCCLLLPECEAEFIRDLPAACLPAVEDDPGLRGFLAELNLRTVGALARFSEAEWASVLPDSGPRLHRQALARDAEPVRPPLDAPALERAHRFATPSGSPAGLRAEFRRLAEELLAILRGRGRAPRRLTVTVEYADGATRQLTLRHHSAYAWPWCELFQPQAAALLARRVRIRRLRLGFDICTPLVPTLFDGEDRRERLETTLAALRGRFGAARLGFGDLTPVTEPRTNTDQHGKHIAVAPPPKNNGNREQVVVAAGFSLR